MDKQRSQAYLNCLNGEGKQILNQSIELVDEDWEGVRVGIGNKWGGDRGTIPKNRVNF
jgi:hypothetical protein